MPSLHCIVTARTPDVRSPKNDSFFFSSLTPHRCQRKRSMSAAGLCPQDPAFSTERHVVFSSSVCKESMDGVGFLLFCFSLRKRCGGKVT